MTQDKYVCDPDDNYFDLHLTPSHEELMKEFFWYIGAPHGNLRMYSSKNLVINTFQQEFMFRKERELWDDPGVRSRLIANRKKYLGDDVTLTPMRILNGFKISGIHRGYSGFNPLVVQWFIEHYHLENQICYDPCGGWGHRILGSGKFGGIIYNDKSPEILSGVKTLIKYFDLPNITLYNNDCSTWEPQQDFDVIFTCPPYYNIEDYGHVSFKSRGEFDKFIDSILDTYNNRRTCHICGIVIKDDLMHRDDYVDKFPMIKHQSHFNKQASKESLFVWRG